MYILCTWIIRFIKEQLVPVGNVKFFLNILCHNMMNTANACSNDGVKLLRKYISTSSSVKTLYTKNTKWKMRLPYYLAPCLLPLIKDPPCQNKLYQDEESDVSLEYSREVIRFVFLNFENKKGCIVKSIFLFVIWN